MSGGLGYVERCPFFADSKAAFNFWSSLVKALSVFFSSSLRFSGLGVAGVVKVLRVSSASPDDCCCLRSASLARNAALLSSNLRRLSDLLIGLSTIGFCFLEGILRNAAKWRVEMDQ
ncbi:unnamed protein product [Cylicocyclus nassatus]|uniref:Uncharacterized protein n=1 Tax=Cylicocyclus nassatus TaxID=53992 RepID=A0AA36DKJ7_CYLNA|nr:unnamed protein product [Cylicocyclus nassatus]